MTIISEAAKRIPYLRSCLEECIQPINAKIIGEIPEWLNGTLLRNGPGLQQIGETKYNHMFDGLALIHRFHINNGKVEYENRFLRSDSYKRNIKANRIVVSEFGTRGYPDPCLSIWGRFMSYFKPQITDNMTDNDNVNIYSVRDQLYASTETNFIRRIDENSLETHEKVDLSKYLTINTATAHPHIDSDNNVYNMGSSFGPRGEYKLIKIPNVENPFGNASIVCSLPMERTLNPSYYHSFSMTDNYFIFIEQPLVISVSTLATSHITGKSYAESLTWKPNLMTRFYVIQRKDGKVLKTKYISDPFVFFHTINAFEDENHLIVDICCYPDGQVVKGLFAESLRDAPNPDNNQKFNNDTRSQVLRFVLPLIHDSEKIESEKNMVTLNYTTATASKKADDSSIILKHESLTPSGPGMGELPRINYKRFNGKKYRYFYALSRDEGNHTQLFKFDINNKQSLIWSEDNAIPSEPVFIERPNSMSDILDEDDGVVLSSVLSELDETKAFLLILDAKTFKEIARANFETKSAITGDFHGIFVS